METSINTDLNYTGNINGIHANDLAQKVSEAAHRFSGELTHHYGRISEQARELGDKSVALVRKYPVYSILGAAAVGVLIGTFVRKKLV